MPTWDEEWKTFISFVSKIINIMVSKSFGTI
jgi:hypothetical protein